MHPGSYPVLIFLWALKLLKIFGLPLGAVVALGVRRLYQKWRANQALAWPVANAIILGGQVKTTSRGLVFVELTYSYFVAEYRAGKYLRRLRRAEDAEEFIRQMKDKHVQVRYRESNPEHSVILDRDIEMLALLTPQMR
jgi:uncharacterized SAM-binding protein YcdF (DUF218 family)